MNTLTEGMMRLSVQFPPFIMAVVFHEFAHGFVANQWGDKTAKDAGRLTLNPIPHMDPLGTLAFPIINMFTGIPILFGWARPVPINPSRFKKYRHGLFWVAAAGPGMNVLLAFLSALALIAVRLWMPTTFYLHEPLDRMTEVSVQLNYALAIFNLIPLPPLDGSKIVGSVLPYNTAQKYESIAQYSFFIMMALLLTGAFSVLYYPISFCSEITLYLAASIFRVFGAF